MIASSSNRKVKKENFMGQRLDCLLLVDWLVYRYFSLPRHSQAEKAEECGGKQRLQHQFHRCTGHGTEGSEEICVLSPVPCTKIPKLWHARSVRLPTAPPAALAQSRSGLTNCISLNTWSDRLVLYAKASNVAKDQISYFRLLSVSGAHS